MLIIQRPTVESIGEEEANRQRFAVGPLDPGFGHTLGNSLRRTLLSSIPGASITQVRFDDALHEFTTLPGVKEDVTDLILNLKDLLFRVHSEEPVTIRLDKRGPGDATAGDLQVPADVEVLSPTQHIASLNAKGRLAVDLTVERGRGYLSADKNKRSTTIGVIPVDAIFSPVRRVAFTVEPVRVEQSTDFDRLVIDIETDGSLTPREALASAGDTLRTLVGLVADLEDEPMGLELGEVGTIGTGSPDLDLRIEDLDLTERPRNCLKRAQINTIGELVDRTLDDLLNITNSGRSRSTRCCRNSTSGACPCGSRTDVMLGTPKKGRRFGGSSAHQKAMMGNLVASLIAAEYLVTTEAKAKALRPVAEKVITAAARGGVARQRNVVAFIRDRDMTHKLFEEIGPRYAERPGGYTRILKLGNRQGDSAPMARIELV